jgi:hypothetical protein
LVFVSNLNLTGYDTANPDCNEAPGSYRCKEVYLYSDPAGELTCLSCSPFGPPSGESGLPQTSDGGLNGHGLTLNRTLTPDGRYAFFNTPDPLVARDANGRLDVYAYDVEHGEVALLSTGQCNCNSIFVNASPDGHDVFFTTRQQLVRIDSDNLSDIYDARIGGGIASQNAVPPAQCQGDACQPLDVPPPATSPSSSTFQGTGNPVAKRKKARARHKKKRHRHRAARHGRAAKTNRGGAR